MVLTTDLYPAINDEIDFCDGFCGVFCGGSFGCGNGLVIGAVLIVETHGRVSLRVNHANIETVQHRANHTIRANRATKKPDKDVS